jgi:hypothetical protein
MPAASPAFAARSAAAVSPYGPLERAIERLTEVLDQETAALRARTAAGLQDFNDRKSQGLLDLNRALRQCEGAASDETVLARLAGLRARLDVNRSVLRMHLEAVREVAGVVADAIRDAESDGTYSPSIRGGARS